MRNPPVKTVNNDFICQNSGFIHLVHDKERPKKESVKKCEFCSNLGNNFTTKSCFA